MKINVELDLDYLSEFDGTLNDLVKDELSSQIAKKLSEIVDTKIIKEIYYDKEVQAAKEFYKIKAAELSKKRCADSDRIDEELSDVMLKFLGGTVIKVDYRGNNSRELSINEYINEKIKYLLQDGMNRFDSVIDESVRRYLRYENDDIEKLVKEKLDKERAAQRREVAEFLTDSQENQMLEDLLAEELSGS